MPIKKAQNEKTRIVRIVTRLNIGGPAIHTILLNEELNNGEFDSVLVTGSPAEDEGDMEHLAQTKGVETIFIPELKRKMNFVNDLIAFLKIFNLIRRKRPHIIHTHMAKAGALGRLAAILLRVPVKVHTFHGHIFHSYFSPIETRLFLFIEKIIARFTDQVIVVSERLKDEVCHRFKVADETKTSVIRLGLDLERFNDVNKKSGILRKELNIDNEKLLVGIIGRLTAVKNHKLFLDAIRLLKEESPDLNARFLVVGDGELRNNLQEYAALSGIKDWVYFIGWRTDMPVVYADLDIVVLTSLNEGTPLSLIEVMMSQKPVVATAVGGVPDLVKDKETGLLVESSNVEQLKRAIVALLQNEELRRSLGREGREHVSNIYSKERLVNDVENLYKKLLRRK